MKAHALAVIATVAFGLGVATRPPLAASSGAQEPGAHQHSPYAGHETSEIPSLTPEELTQLREGEGMGFARPAELNHYPGPRHVLDLAAELGITDEQRARTEEIFVTMQRQARAIGEQIIEAERHLNMSFANGHVDEPALSEATAAIAELYGRLRFAHLRAHLEVTALLSPVQVEHYDRLRGYGG